MTSPTKWTMIPLKRDKDRREGKGRRYCLGGRIDSSLCCTCYFASGRLEDLDELHQDDMKNWMNCTRTKWRKGWIVPFLQLILMQNSSDDLCLLFCILLLMQDSRKCFPPAWQKEADINGRRRRKNRPQLLLDWCCPSPHVICTESSVFTLLTIFLYVLHPLYFHLQTLSS